MLGTTAKFQSSVYFRVFTRRSFVVITEKVKVQLVMILSTVRGLVAADYSEHIRMLAEYRWADSCMYFYIYYFVYLLHGCSHRYCKKSSRKKSRRSYVSKFLKGISGGDEYIWMVMFGAILQFTVYRNTKCVTCNKNPPA